MEAVLERSLPASLIKIGDLEDASLMEAKKLCVDRQENSSKLSSSTNKDDLVVDQGTLEIGNSTESCSSNENQEGRVKSAKGEMGEIREENQKLKLMLTQVLKDYNSLQLHFHDIVQHEEPKNSEDTNSAHQENEESDELVCLSLGRFPIELKEKKKATKHSEEREDDKFGEGLALGLDCRYDPSLVESKNSSPENSLNETKEEEPTEMWPPSKSLKKMRDGDNDVLHQNPLKKARVSVRAHCNTPTMNDGCQWRKYGQKIAKGNPCPRAYYRCTVSPSCPVRKQVQRCAADMSILITTYEGTHDHPLPVSATAMACATSAAASILRSASSSSQPGLGATANTAISTTANLHGLNFSSTNSNTNAVTHQTTCFPKASISTSQSHPTITIDLTTPPASTEFSKLSSSILSAPRYSSTCLNFSSSSNTTIGLNSTQSSWTSGLGYLSYGAQTNNRYLGKQPSYQENFYQPYMLQNSQSTTSTNSQPPLMSDTIVAATKAITSNPSFQSALTAAIKSFVGKKASDQSGQNTVKWGDQSFPLISSTLAFPPTQNANRCSTSCLNRFPSLNTEQGNHLTLCQPSVPLSATKGASSVSSSEKGEHIKSDRFLG